MNGPMNADVPRVSAASGRWPATASAPHRRKHPTLRVDWPRCKAHGLCHEVLPEAVELDDWGYPVVDPSVLMAGDMLDAARRAVLACPTLALRVVNPS